MNASNPVIHDAAAIRAALLKPDVMEAVRGAFIAHARGDVVSPIPGQLLFADPPGDCHIKYGYFRGGDYFVIKVAIGFYQNPARGLPTNNGMVLVFDAKTGKTRAVLNDEGLLTSFRTAAAGALAARAGAPTTVTRLGIAGTGHQAALQAEWTSNLLGINDIAIWGRTPEAAEKFADTLRAERGLNAHAVASVDALLGSSNVVITCTPATAAYIRADMVRPGTHIVALGADSPGKQELAPEIFAKSRVIMTDDRAQCLDHGDLHYAVQKGLVYADCDVSLGKVLAGEALGRTSDTDITVCDLTGLPAQDVAIASLAFDRLR